jgi:hypothetical protein
MYINLLVKKGKNNLTKKPFQTADQEHHHDCNDTTSWTDDDICTNEIFSTLQLEEVKKEYAYVVNKKTYVHYLYILTCGY